MKKAGITGTIGAGKTTVSILLRRRGLPVFDCDQYARILYQKIHPCYQKMIQEFGEEILDRFGELDRKKIASIIFSNPEKRKKLDRITHPAIIAGMENFFKNHSHDPLVFAEVPLLVQAGMEKYFDEIILVTCSDDTAIARMMEDRDYTKEAAISRLASQKDFVPRQKECATHILVNDGSIKDLDRAVSRLVKELS